MLSTKTQKMPEHLDDIAPGKGLMTQLKNEHKVVYKSNPMPDLKQVMDAMQRDQDKQVARKALGEMLQKVLITPAEYGPLLKMIDSPDYENFELAKGIMETRLTENGMTIERMGQSREFVIRTGARGEELLNEAIHEELKKQYPSKNANQHGNTIHSGDAQI